MFIAMQMQLLCTTHYIVLLLAVVVSKMQNAQYDIYYLLIYFIYCTHAYFLVARILSLNISPGS